MHSVKLGKKLFTLWSSSPEFAEISLRMSFVSSCRVCGFVLYALCFTLPHKYKSQGVKSVKYRRQWLHQIKRSSMLSGGVKRSSKLSSSVLKRNCNFSSRQQTFLHYESSRMLLVTQLAVIQWCNATRQVMYTVEQRKCLVQLHFMGDVWSHSWFSMLCLLFVAKYKS